MKGYGRDVFFWLGAYSLGVPTRLGITLVINDDASDEIHNRVYYEEAGVYEPRFPIGAEMFQALRQASNLSHIYICRTDHRPKRLPVTGMDFSIWTQPGPLRELHLDHTWGVQPQAIHEWQNQFNFSQIEVVRLHKQLGGWFQDLFPCWKLFRDLICYHRPFPSLKALELQLDCITLENCVNTYFCSVISDSLQCLPPLRELILEHWGKALPLQPILDRHGATLRKLSLKDEGRSASLYCLSNRMLTSFLLWNQGSFMNRRSHFPIEGLQLNICGRHSQPTAGCASCEASDPHAVHYGSCEDYRQKLEGGPHICRYGGLKQFMADSALDKDLACAIFREIATSKPKGSPRLESMNIRVEELDISGLGKICVFPIAWRVESRMRFQAPDEAVAWEIDCTDDILAKRKNPLRPEWEKTFNSIWPDHASEPDTHLRSAPANDDLISHLEALELRSSSEDCKRGDPNWWTKWKSFPLQVLPQ